MRVHVALVAGAIVTVVGGASRNVTNARTCSYATYTWNAASRRAVDHHVVYHPYAALEAWEQDPTTGCTVCLEDQVTVELSNGVSFRACRVLEAAVAGALERALAANQPVFTVTGYRVGMTKGPLDDRGNRTQFSNHSFGVAFDINAQYNGLYDRCQTFGPTCRLVRGGAWSADRPGSLRPHSPVVEELAKIGLRWGGQIQGQQKDFMHFSLTGY